MSERREPDKRGLYGQRPSKSADAARRDEFAEIAKMSARERALLALQLGEEFEELIRYLPK